MAEEEQVQSTTVMATATRKPKPALWGCLGCLGVIGVVGLLAFGVVALKSTGLEGEGKGGGRVHRLLYDWKHDHNASEHWVNGLELKRLNGVTDYYQHVGKAWTRQHPDGSTDPDWIVVSFTVKSAMQIGIPVEKKWYFEVARQPNGEWLVEDFSDRMP